MSVRQIELGDVYETNWTANPIRIIALDADVVMYDAWWPHKGAWGMAKLRGSFTYYRIAREALEVDMRYLRSEPLTQEEKEVHRPDLSLSFGRNNTLSWYDEWPVTDLASSKQLLEAPAIFIGPFGPRDSTKPYVLVEAENGKFFKEAELLALAKTIQSPYLGEARLTQGVGIYRSGIKSRIPSFYIWGSRSRSENEQA